MENKSFVAIDLETTGLDFEKDEINSPNNIDTSNINKNKDINKSEKKKDCVIF